MEDWLKSLDIKVKSYEEDFSNGYLIGSILDKYNYISDFGTFVNSVSGSYMNLTKLQFVLGRQGISFDPHKLLNKDPAYAKKLLRAIKAHLDRSPEQPPFSKTEQMNKHTEKFTAQKLMQSHQAHLKNLEQVEKEHQFQADFRKEHIDTIKTNKVFMQQWEAQGKKQWQQNQQQKHARIKHDLDVKTKLANDFKRKESKKLQAISHDVYSGIDEFEKNMIRLGIDHEQKKKKKINLEAEAMFTMARIKEAKAKNDLALKQKALREKKLLQEEERTKKLEKTKQAGALISKSIGAMIGRNTQPSLKTLQKYFKSIKNQEQSMMAVEDISMKSYLRWGAIEEARQRDIKTSEAARQRGLPTYKLEIHQRLIEKTKETREQHYKVCEPVMHMIIDLVEEASELQKIPESVWKEWLSYFKQGVPIGGEEDDVILEPRTEEEEEAFSPRLAELDTVKAYLECTGGWTDHSPPNDDYLGDALERIFEFAFPDPPREELPEGPHYLPLKLCILGPPFAGKKTQAKKLVEAFGLKTFDLGQVLEDAKKVIQKRSEPEDPRKKKTAEEESALFLSAIGEEIDDSSAGKSALFRAKIRGILGDQAPVEEEVKKPAGKKEEVKCQGLALLGSPSNLEEAKALEFELSKYIHPSDLPEPVSSIKQKEAEILVVPTPKPVKEKPLEKSFFDLVLWINVGQEICIQRAIERRVDPAGNVYNMVFNPPPDNLLPKCKPIEKPTQEEMEEMYGTYEAHKTELTEWLEQFGVEHWNWKTFFSIDGEETPEAVTEVIMNKARELLEIKGSPPETPPPVTSKTFRDEEIEIPQSDASDLVNLWEFLKDEYLKALAQSLAMIDSHFNKFVNSLSSVSESFLEFLTRPDEKTSIAADLVCSLNKELLGKKYMVRDEIEDLKGMIEERVNEIWDFIDSKKEESIAHRERLLENSTIDGEFKGIIKLSKRLLLAEISKYVRTYNILGQFRKLTAGEEFEPLEDVDIFVNWKLQDWNAIIENLASTAKNIIVPKDWAELTTKGFMFRIELVKKWTLSAIEMYREKNKELFVNLDRWIAHAVSFENNALNDLSEKLYQALEYRSQIEDYAFPSNEDLKISFTG